MKHLPLTEIRLDWRGHRSALWWVGLLYRKPRAVEQAEASLSRGQRAAAVLRIYLHATPYLLIASALGRWLLFGVFDPERKAVFGVTEGFWYHAGGLAFGLAVGLAFGLAFGLAVGLAGGLAFGLAGGLAFGLAGGLAGGLAESQAVGFASGLAFGVAYLTTFLRLYYLPIHVLFVWPGTLASRYRLHPAAWDDCCFLPLSGFDRLLVAFAALDRDAAEGEIDRLIDDSPGQRGMALRARAILIARDAAAIGDLARLDEALADLPQGKKGFLAETRELRDQVHPIAAAQARLDTLERPFLREPYAALLVKEIETFERRIAGFRPPLSLEFRKAARAWLEVARRQLHDAQDRLAREPTRQVFRAGDPVDRDQEAFVPRHGLLGELERQVMLATGCPGLVLYGRRRLGKSTLLRNLGGFLPPTVQVANLSMQRAAAFTSLGDLLALLAETIAGALGRQPGQAPADLRRFEQLLGRTDSYLDGEDQRLLLALDEYENLDRKIGEGVLSEDLLAVVRESIQSHRRIIWAFVGSHRIDELANAPWTSYLVSARTVEMEMFSPEETRLLLTEPLRHSTLWPEGDSARPSFEPGFWGDGGIERIHAEAGGWPHLVQLAAETVVDLVNDAGRSQADGELLESAFERAVTRGDIVFRELLERESTLPGEWEYLRGFRREQEQPPPVDEAVERSLRRRLLIAEEGDRWHLRVPLMQRWLRQRA